MKMRRYTSLVITCLLGLVLAACARTPSNVHVISTDALETLGMIHFRPEHRDAIHLAVEAVEAGEEINPGADIGIGEDGKAYVAGEFLGGDIIIKALGIADPFITRTIKQGERFWLVVYPRQIKSLRHVWEHPNFPPSV